MAYFHKIFDQIRQIWTFLYFVKFLNFDANKGKVPLFGLTTVVLISAFISLERQEKLPRNFFF